MRKPEPDDQFSLLLSEQTFPIIEQITAGMPGGFFIYHADRNEQLIYANRALIRIFGFRLSDAPDNQDTSEAAAVTLHLNGRHLLLAEDNELNQEIAIAILEDIGCTVDVASNGAETVEKVRHCAANPYDLILMDIQMPVMNGIDAAKAIRALDDPRLAHLPIVAMTANAFEEDRQLVLSAGMNAHLGKPIDVDKLFSTLQNLLGNT